MGSYIKTILILIVLVVLVTFGIKNNETMILQYYFQLSSMPVPVYAVVYVSLLVGIFIGMIVGISARFSQRKKIKELQQENRTLKGKVADSAVEEPAAEEPEAEEPEAEKKEIAETEASMDETQVIRNNPEDEEEKKEADL